MEWPNPVHGHQVHHVQNVSFNTGSSVESELEVLILDPDRGEVSLAVSALRRVHQDAVRDVGVRDAELERELQAVGVKEAQLLSTMFHQNLIGKCW